MEELKPKFKILNLSNLKLYTNEVIGYQIKNKTLSKSYKEVMRYLNKSDYNLDFVCSNCNSVLDENFNKCWACGLSIISEEEDEMIYKEIVERAKKLKIRNIKNKDVNTLIEEIEIMSKVKSGVDFNKIESKRIKAELLKHLPDGWKFKNTIKYYSFCDRYNVKRITLFKRGIKIGFTVHDGYLDDYDDVCYLDQAERVRQHFGKINYIYDGDCLKDAIIICIKVFRRYSI